jgi:hypothetical protein
MGELGNLWYADSGEHSLIMRTNDKYHYTLLNTNFLSINVADVADYFNVFPTFTGRTPIANTLVLDCGI